MSGCSFSYIFNASAGAKVALLVTGKLGSKIFGKMSSSGILGCIDNEGRFLEIGK